MGKVYVIWSVIFYDHNWDDMPGRTLEGVELPEIVRVLEEYKRAWQYPNANQCPEALRYLREVSWFTITPTMWQISPITGDRLYITNR